MIELSKPKNAPHAGTLQVSKKWVCTRTLQLATAHCNSQLAIVHRKSRISLSQVMNCTSLLMNNSLVHEENRNKTQVLELIPYFHFFFLLKAEQCSEGILMIDCLNVNYFIIFSTKKLRNTFILHHGLVPQCHTAYLWHIFWKIKFQHFL